MGPYYRFIESGNTENGGSDVLDRIRNFPKGATPEDQMRELMRGGIEGISIPDDASDDSLQSLGNQSAQDALDYLYRIMYEDGPFDGIIGYSEGATVAATLLLHEQRRFETHGIEPMFKCALFFAGWPPMTPELDTILLADESDLMITIPTCHVSKFNHIITDFFCTLLTLIAVGSLDPYLAGSIALYNICDMDTAYLFDHAKGHTLPRDKDTVKELGDIIRGMVSNVSA